MIKILNATPINNKTNKEEKSNMKKNLTKQDIINITDQFADTMSVTGFVYFVGGRLCKLTSYAEAGGICMAIGTGVKLVNCAAKCFADKEVEELLEEDDDADEFNGEFDKELDDWVKGESGVEDDDDHQEEINFMAEAMKEILRADEHDNPSEADDSPEEESTVDDSPEEV